MKKNSSNKQSRKGKRIPLPHPAGRSANTYPPKFSLQYLDKDYSLAQCSPEQKATFADTLYRLSQLTWNEIYSAPRQGLGKEYIQRESINAPIPDHITPDVRIMAFRCFGKCPMVGYREERLFIFYGLFLIVNFIRTEISQ